MPAAVRTSDWTLRLAQPDGKREWIIAGVSALGAALIAICFFAPRFWLWPAAGMPLRDLVAIQPELHRAYYALQQLQDPWQKIDSDVNRVIEWRLLWPVVAHYTGMSPKVYFALPFAGCLAALAVLAGFVWRATRDGVVTACATLLVATTSWFFVSTGWLAYFDSWLVLALLLASFAQRRAVLFATALLAPWIDERFILALPLCVGVRALDATNRNTLWSDARWLAGGIAPYVAIRIGAEIFHVRSTSASYWTQRPMVPAPLEGMWLGLWHGLRLGWIPVVLAAVAGARGKHWFALGAVAMSFLANVCIADDLSRSSSVAVPMIVAGIVCWSRRPMLHPRWSLALLGAANLLLPAAHIIATPLSQTECYHTTAIRSLPAEREQARHPPAFADPAVYNERGLQALAAGENAIARAQFELALRFDPECARARANLGIVLCASGHPKEALAEIDRALARDPALFDVRLQRATFRQRLGDLRGAAQDAQEALRAMPPDWPRQIGRAHV